MKLVKRLLLTLALAAGLTFAISSPASAAFSDCPTGQGCVWTSVNGTGVIFQIPYGTYGPVGTCHNMPGLMPGNTESWRVTYGNNYGLQFWTNSGCVLFHGSTWKEHAGTAGNFSGTEINSAYSFKIIYYP